VTVVVLTAPAKVTLSLRITGVRDDGYHLIDAEMVTIDLADTLHLDVSHLDVSPGDPAANVGSGRGRRATRVTVDGPEAPGIDAGGENLVARALDATGQRAEVRVVKRIPAGAGLGGGSADAAAILRWAGVVDPSVAVGIGADVPFCVVGGRARVRGVGEDVEPLAHRAMTLTLATPPFRCSTPAVYAAWDALGGPRAPGPNDLEGAALRVEPRLARWRDELGEATGCTPVLAGSGSTYFVAGSHPGPGRRVVHTVPAGWSGPDGE
jgi:4-diphosphocytidyl-2-C-methyl-D-erythritol kinase